MSQNKLVIATRNIGKLNEFKKLLNPLNIEVLSLADFPQIGEINENGETFEENALIKAREVTKNAGIISLADDSGLEVDYLQGLPGVISARFAGEPSDDQKNNQKLLKLLTGVPLDKRTARFKCVIAIVKPDGSEFTVEGSCEGFILEEEKGSSGFGYDPLFYVPEYAKTFAQLELEVKNKISHRGKATQKAIKILTKIFNAEVVHSS
ncbi:MAG: XTP/dITP diphosphohydrolase [Clostridia bacterium]|jgi:XTP/dITP diphosphohydrolase|nr:XTP/dITP diphosphohydrolase [Clostridia bacterium]MDN5321801.1 XTP/dITP diphosphohydrolase [Clostridia bacterium]